jgi:hypothetical protein
VCGGFILGGSVSHALYRLACKLLALFVLASPLREQGPSNRVRYETPSGVITGPSLSRVVPSLQWAILSLGTNETVGDSRVALLEVSTGEYCTQSEWAKKSIDHESL